ncbi:single-stranded DNA-binding protein [Paratissierella segnis]|jgi:single-strand DNA-binding protein|uniref:Single-stranded DNA-binding protein n=1 Tax=Paratissierella segnis TaxID=2763679 RepID=A0A926EW27_9FIRM|nr:single-stranded DNA-binding protein [Paratissierella segnis]MBC8587364.1 single-stranded DNA-binding protein [Paratissierella segnis]
MNNVVLIGRLTRDPELRYIPTGTAVSTFTIAVDKSISREKKQEMESKNQPTADFIRIVVWGKQAENCANYLTKGSQVGVQGRIQTGSYDDKDGNRRYTTDIVANSVEFLGSAGAANRTPQYNEPDMDFSDIEGFHPTDNNDDIPF